jgi:DNA-binding transcriptional LysR family regulator
LEPSDEPADLAVHQRASGLSTLAKCGSLTIAAGELGVTRSALSHRIADLEAQLGVALLRKAGRRAALTDDAEALLAAVGNALDRLGAAVQPLRRRRTQLRLSTVTTFASHWLIPRLADFRIRHPQIEIAISTTTRPIDFASEDFDCAIRQGHGAWDGLASTLLFQETLAPVAAPAIADEGAGGASPVGWISAPFIYARSRYIDWSLWWRVFGQPGEPPDPAIVVETRAQALDAALAGAGVAMMDAAYVRQHVAAGRLRMLAGPPARLSEGYWFAHSPRGRNGRAVAALRDWLVEAARPFRS